MPLQYKIDVLNALKFKLYCNDYVKSEGDIKTYEVNKDDCKYILIWNNNAYGDKICHGKTYKNENGKTEKVYHEYKKDLESLHKYLKSIILIYCQCK